MATLLRQEGDYTYWSDGAQRYAKGNTQGKQAGGLARRHPKASLPFDQRPKHERKHIAKLGADARHKARRVAVSDAHAYVLRSTHPDARTEEQGLRMLAEAEFTQGNEAEGGSAVRARAQFYEQYTGGKRDDRVIDARQVHITISPGVEQDQKRLVHNLLGDTIDEEDVD